MIDLIVLKIPFQSHYCFAPCTALDAKTGQFYRALPEPLSLLDLQVPLQVNFFSTGEPDHDSVRHPWETLPSSFAGMACKIFDFRNTKDPTFFVGIKCSPAKIMQGHNVYGSDDLRVTSQFMLNLLKQHYPVLCDYLNFDAIEVEQLDITYFSKADSNREAQQFITALANVSKGQTKGRTGYAGETAYFGKKNSRLKKLKVYFNLAEVENYKASLEKSTKNKSRKVADLSSYKLAKIYTDDLLFFCEGMIRWEASLKTRWFERRQIPTGLTELCAVFNPEHYWNLAFKDLFEALAGEEFRLVEDEKVEELLKAKFFTVSEKTGKLSYVKALSAYRTYRAIKFEGFIEVKRTASNGTFYRHLEMLTEVGLSRALLQNLKGEGMKGEVIPMVRFIVVNFGGQFPADINPKTHYQNILDAQVSAMNNPQLQLGAA